jgi:hypothetical protein
MNINVYLSIDKIFSLYKFNMYSGLDVHLLNLMNEEEKKLYVITQINTKINREKLDKSEYYANESMK